MVGAQRVSRAVRGSQGRPGPPRGCPRVCPPLSPTDRADDPHFPVLLIPSNRSQGVKINAWRESEAYACPQLLSIFNAPLLPEGYSGFGSHWDGLRWGWARKGVGGQGPQDTQSSFP